MSEVMMSDVHACLIICYLVTNAGASNDANCRISKALEGRYTPAPGEARWMKVKTTQP